MADRPHALTPAARGRAEPSPRETLFRSLALVWLTLLSLALIVPETLWLRWFLSEPLPNAGRAGGEGVRRSMFLLRSLPGVVPRVTFSESYLGMACRELSHVENLPQRGPIVLAAGAIVAAALAVGSLLLRALRLRDRLERWERVPLEFGLGTVGLGILTLLTGRLGLIGPWPVRIGLGLLIAAGIGVRWRAGAGGPPARPRLPSTAFWLFVLVAGPFLLPMALGSMLPTIDFDALEYHLQGPKEYFQAGRIAFLPHNVYTSMPFGVEMLHLLGMEVLGDWRRGAGVGQLLVMLHAPAAAAFVWLAARRWGSPRAAWTAALVYLTTPWVFRLAVIPYVEGPFCYFHAALVWVTGRAWGEVDESRRRRLWGVVGLLAGGAMACKYTALISAVIPFGIVALIESIRRRSWPIVAAFVAGWLLVIGPWLVKNVVDTGNPVHPLGHRVFGGRHWSESRDRKWAAVHGPKPVSAKALKESLVDVGGRSDWQSPLYAALAPLALLRRGSRRFSLALIVFVGYIFGTWWLFTHRLDRFWLPLLPAAAVLAGLGADWSRNLVSRVALVAILGVSILTNWTYDTTALVGLNQWTGDFRRLDRSIPLDLNLPLARLDAELPEGAKPLLVGQASVFHLDRPIVYNTVFDDEIFETLARGRAPAEVGRELERLGITHIYVDWFEIQRYRGPGNYGFTPFVRPEEFSRLVDAGVLEPPKKLGARQELYRVKR